MDSPSCPILQGTKLDYSAAEEAKEFMSPTIPITQRDVAEACGLHPSTVSLALKNSPSIPLPTRRRIQLIAEELGYQLNVAARNLALLRTERTGAGNLPVAWINQESRRDHWRVDPEARLYFEGARRRAEELGYHLEEIWTQEPGMTAARVMQIIRARGIQGVLFPADRSFDFSLLNPGWTEFSLVGVNDHRLGEWIDVVCPDYYRNTDVVLRRLRQLGFERIGLVLTTQFDAATSGLVHSCFLRHQADAATGERVPVLFAKGAGADAAAFRDWLGEHRPDAVLVRDSEFAGWVRASRTGTACVQLHGSCEQFDGGIEPSAQEIAAAVVDCLSDKIRRFDRGIRDSTRLHLIKGVWQERYLAQRDIETVVA